MTKPLALEHSMMATFILPVARALRLRGIDALDVMEDIGIDAAKAANPDWRVTHTAFNSLMGRCVEVTGDEAFGLLAAEQLQPQVLHGLGLAWLASDTVYDGLRRLVRFGKLVSTTLDLHLREENDLVHIDLGRNVEMDNFAYANRDYAVGMVIRMSQMTLGEFLAPVKIDIERPTPEDPERWEYMLSSRVAFETDSTCITWSRADIMEPLATGDPALARVNDEQTQAYLDSFLIQTTSREVVDKIVEKLPDGPPNQQQIAEALHVSNRTLQRKLKEEGTSFMDLLQDTRLQLARKYLRQPNRSVVETSYLLGFSEPSTFSRAFKRWTGMAPAEFRDTPSDPPHR
ncbi:MAG: helix-turn-helix domain-containing protein [Haliea sp.]|jgi:AraC-like DNA-binding protein|nr:helix-turn-helix domain-containing protein [Haliea sp.]